MVTITVQLVSVAQASILVSQEISMTQQTTVTMLTGIVLAQMVQQFLVALTTTVTTTEQQVNVVQV